MRRANLYTIYKLWSFLCSQTGWNHTFQSCQLSIMAPKVLWLCWSTPSSNFTPVAYDDILGENPQKQTKNETGHRRMRMRGIQDLVDPLYVECNRSCPTQPNCSRCKNLLNLNPLLGDIKHQFSSRRKEQNNNNKKTNNKNEELWQKNKTISATYHPREQEPIEQDQPTGAWESWTMDHVLPLLSS